jgi:hypothetical protein
VPVVGASCCFLPEPVFSVSRGRFDPTAMLEVSSLFVVFSRTNEVTLWLGKAAIAVMRVPFAAVSSHTGTASPLSKSFADQSTSTPFESALTTAGATVELSISTRSDSFVRSALDETDSLLSCAWTYASDRILIL